jgi:hypothetical protein
MNKWEYTKLGSILCKYRLFNILTTHDWIKSSPGNPANRDIYKYLARFMLAHIGIYVHEFS